jgi:hypothetical protein
LYIEGCSAWNHDSQSYRPWMMPPSSGTPNQDPTPPREDEKMKKRKNSIDDEDKRGPMGPWCKIKEVAIDAVAEAEAEAAR